MSKPRKSTSVLPRDVIWRTVNGARVAISPRSGMVMAGPAALFGKRLNRTPVRVSVSGKEMAPSELEEWFKTAPAGAADNDVRTAAARSKKAEALLKKAESEAFFVEQIGVVGKYLDTHPDDIVAEVTRRLKDDPWASHNDLDFAAAADIPQAQRMLKRYRATWEAVSAQAELRQQAIDSDPNLAMLHAGGIRTAKNNLRDPASPGNLLGELGARSAGASVKASVDRYLQSDGTSYETLARDLVSRSMAKRAAAADALQVSPTALERLNRDMGFKAPSAKGLQAYVEADTAARGAATRLVKTAVDANRVSRNRVYDVEAVRDAAKAELSGARTLRNMLRAKPPRKLDAPGDHWGTADSENPTAIGIAYAGAQRFRPIDKGMRNVSLTASPAVALQGIAMRNYAQRAMGEVSRDDVPTLSRGMIIETSQVQRLVDGSTKSIQLTGTTSFGMSPDVADHYARSVWSANTGTARQRTAKDTTSVIVRLKRDDAVDQSVGMYMPWDSAADTEGFRSAPAYEVVSTLSRVKVTGTSVAGGITYVDVEAP